MQSGFGLEQRQSRSLAMTEDLRSAIGLLRLSNHELMEFATVRAAGNHHLRVWPAMLGQFHKTWVDHVRLVPVPPIAGRLGEPGANVGPGGLDRRLDDWTPSAPPGLLAHVAGQIDLVVRDPAQRPIAYAYLDALEPTGWLSCSPAEIAAECGCRIADAIDVLARLQQIEPAGLFARSLAECLRIQALDADVLTEDFAALLDNLEHLANGDLDILALRCGCDMTRLQDMIQTLRGMNPKPGAGFDEALPPVAAPDLIVSRDGDRWMIELNRSNLPAVEVVQTGETETSAADLHAAFWLERAVSRRNATTLRIAREVIGRQTGYLAHGRAALLPLSFRDIALATGLHVSTISRVTSGLRVALPRRTVDLRDLFSAALGATASNPGVSRDRVLDRIRELIGAEDPSAPLRDEDIVRHFQAEGLVLARRTVAKYRAVLRIPGAARRHRKPEAPATF